MLKQMLWGISVLTLSSIGTLAQAPTSRPAFTLAEIHESPHMQAPFASGGELRGDRVVFHQSTLVDLIARAWNTKPELVTGGPTWLELKRFEVTAKVGPDTSDADVRLMLRSLLADRFHVTVHDGEAPMPAFVLTAPGGKTKMRQSPEGQASDCRPQPPETAGGAPLMSFSCSGTTLDQITQLLSQAAGPYLTEPVLNQTGLDSKYDFTIRWTDMRFRAKAGAEAISIFQAVENDLGLKLERKTAPRKVLIVDTATEKPTPNSPAVSKELPPIDPPQFEVATIKPSRPDAMQTGRIANGQVNLTGATLKFLMTYAWDISPNDASLIVGAPSWFNETKFDLLAKAPVPEATPGRRPSGIDPEEFRAMIRALLMERFQMKVRLEERPVMAYKLTATDKLKLRPASDPKARSRCKEGPGPDGKDPRAANPIITAVYTCQNITMPEFAELLSQYATGYIYTPLLDATNLKGGYDFTVAWSSASLTVLKPPPPPYTAQSATAAAEDPNGAVTLNEALEKQLGLKLVKERRAVPVLVIDHITDAPIAN